MITIWGKYQGKIEKIDTATDKLDADYLVREYKLAYGRRWQIWAGKKGESE